MTMPENVIYQETVRIQLHNDTVNDFAKFQRTLDGVTKSLDNLKRLRVAVNLGQTQNQLNTVQRSVQQLAKPHTITVRLHDQVTAGLRQIQSRIQQMMRMATAPMRGAGSFASGAGSTALGLAAGGPMGGMLGGGMAAMGNPWVLGGVAAATTLAVSTKAAADFQSRLTEIANNTNMQTKDINTLHDAVLKMGTQSGASFDELANGAMHALNITGDLTRSIEILNVAQQSAVSTGADVSQVTDVLAKAMHEYSLDVGTATQVQQNANRAMGTMHLAASMSNMTLQQFSDNSGKAIGIAANLGIPLEQVGAAYVALTRHGFDAAQAQTQFVDILAHSVNPTKAQVEALTALGKASGMDLLKNFTAAGLSAEGLEGFLSDLHKAYEAVGMSATEATGASMKIINAMRGGLGLSVLLGTGAGDFNAGLAALSNNGAVDALTSSSFARTQQTLNNQLAVLGNELKVVGITIGEWVLPMITPLVSQFATWLPNAIGTTTNVLGNLFGFLRTGSQQDLGSFSVAISNLIPFDAQLAVLTAVDAIKGAFDGLKVAAGMALDWAGGRIDAARAWFDDLGVKLTALRVSDDIKQTWDMLIGTAQSLAKTIAPGDGSIQSNLKLMLPDAQSVANAIKDMTENAKAMAEAFQAIAGFMAGMKALTQGLNAAGVPTPPNPLDVAGGVFNWLIGGQSGQFLDPVGARTALWNALHPQTTIPTFSGSTSNITPHASGGWIKDPLIGVDTRGRWHSIAERGPERIVPAGQGGHTFNVSIDARGADAGVEARLEAWGERFVQDMKRAFQTMPTATGQ